MSDESEVFYCDYPAESTKEFFKILHFLRKKLGYGEDSALMMSYPTQDHWVRVGIAMQFVAIADICKMGGHEVEYLRKFLKGASRSIETILEGVPDSQQETP